MLVNYIKIAWRHLLKERWFTLVHIAGLSVSIAVCILISLYVQDELRYDRFYPHAEDIYRVRLSFFIGEQDYDWPESSALLAPVMREDFSGVKSVASIFPAYPYAFRQGEQVLGGFQMIHADTNFFDFFGYKLLYGNPATALHKSHAVVLTERMARQFTTTGHLSDILGKTLVNDNQTYLVTGVMENPPAQTHLAFDGILSLATMYKVHDYFMEDWQPNGIANYVRLEEGIDPASLHSEFLVVEKQYLWPQMIARHGISEKRLNRETNRYGYYLEPVSDIHLVQEGYQAYVTLFSLVGAFIFFIACANFVNLTMAQLGRRALAVGVRKVLGSSSRNLIAQFFVEILLLSSLSVLLAGIFVQAVLPVFNQLTGKSLIISVADPLYVGSLLCIILLVSVLAGSYPAFQLTTIQPIKTLKGHAHTPYQRFSVRNVLIVLQFVISAALMMGTLLVYEQTQYQQQLSPGFAKNNVLLISNAYSLGQRASAFKATLLQLSGVAIASYSYTVPGGIHDGYPVFGVKGQQETHSLVSFNADEDYLATLGIKLLSGRNFSHNIPTDTASVLINESAVKALGLTQPLGEILLDAWGDSWHIIGVIQDYHYRSLHHTIEPLLIKMNDNSSWTRYLSVKLTADNPSQTIAQLQEAWYAQDPDAPFQYTFLDQQFDALFDSEQKLSQLGSSFTLLSIMIACLGLFGLAAYTAQQRTKEIGIRKVLGASLSSLLLLLAKDYIKLILIALAIAIPVANYFITEWLSGFAYRITLRWWLFVMPAVLVLIIALLSVSGQTLKAVRQNPVDSLRDE